MLKGLWSRDPGHAYDSGWLEGTDTETTIALSYAGSRPGTGGDE